MTTKGNLTPTRIMRKDGHMTTVHKKNDAGSASLGRLAGVAPRISSAPMPSSFEKKKVTTKWEASDFGGSNNYYRGKSHLPIGENSLLRRLGANISLVAKYGQVAMTQGEMYDYLREGIGLPEAAALHAQDPSPKNWVNRGENRKALPGSLSYAQYGEKARLVSIKDAVDALRAHEVTPFVAQKLLLKGFTDDHLGGVLDMEQKVRLFDRFKYQASINEEVETNASATMDALLDGRLPFELFDRNFRRTSLTYALDAIYPKKRQGAEPKSRKKFLLDDSDREYLKNHPDEIVNVVAGMDGAEGKYSSFEDSYKALRLYGADAIAYHSPRLLTMEREDGSLVGVKGAQMARDFRDYCDEKFKSVPGVVVSYDPDRYFRIYEPRGVNPNNKASYLDIIEMKEAGATNDKIADLLYGQKLSGTQALAVVRGETTASIGEGWL